MCVDMDEYSVMNLYLQYYIILIIIFIILNMRFPETAFNFQKAAKLKLNNWFILSGLIATNICILVNYIFV